MQEFELPTPNVEGMTYVPEESSLYVAGNRLLDTGITIGVVDVYHIPMLPVVVATPLVKELSGHPLNGNMINQGLLDSKISSLYLF